MAYDAGEAVLKIVPSLKGVVEQISAEAAKWGVSAGKAFVKTWNDTVKGGIGLPGDTTFARQGAQAGGAFADGFKARVNAALRSLPSPNILVDDKELGAQLADIRAKLEALSNVRVGIDIDEGAALAQLDILKTQLDEIGARSPSVQVRVDVGRASAELAAFQAQLAALDAEIAATDAEEISPGIGVGLAGAASSVSGIVVALGAILVLAAPVGAALVGAFAGVATVLGAVTGGLAVIALGFSGVASAVKSEVAPAFAELQQTAANGLLPGVQEAISALMPLLPALNEFVGTLAHTIGDLAAQAARALSGPFWQQFFGYVTATAGPTLVTFAHIIGNVAKGFAGLLEAFAPVVNQIGQGLERLSEHFANFGNNSSSLRSFVDYVAKAGPEVGHTLEAIGSAILRVLEALAPLGGPALEIIKTFANVISAIPTPILTAAAVAIAAIVAAIVGVAAVGAIAAFIDGFGAIALVVGGVSVIIYELVTHLDDLWGALKKVAGFVGGIFVDAFHLVQKVVSSVVGFIIDHWAQVKPAIMAVLNPLSAVRAAVGLLSNAFGFLAGAISDAFGGVVSFFESIPDKILDFFKDAGKWLFNAGKSIIQGLIDGLESLLGKIGDIVSSILSKLNPLHDIKSVVGSVISHIPGFASGVQNFGGGLAVVGENGPELLNLPPGASVYPNSVYQRVAAPAAVGAGSVPAAAGAGVAAFQGDLYLDSGEFLGVVRGQAHQVIDNRVSAARQRESRGVAGGALAQLER